MLHTIQNQQFCVTASELGAELQSIRSKEGTEFLWQGDPRYWSGRSPVLFPYVGRTINRIYQYDGIEYPMPLHGFAPKSHFALQDCSETHMTFSLKSNPETLKMYPRQFEFRVCYRLNANRLTVLYTVENRDNTAMLLGIGGHPGFLLPGHFEDYSIHFEKPCTPEHITFTPQGYTDSCVPNYPLENGTTLRLNHDLFLQDAVVLKNTGRRVLLDNPKENYRIKVFYPDMPYIGFWQVGNKNAPYLCIEPWSSLPSQNGEKTVFEHQSNLLRLDPQMEYRNEWCIEIG